MHAVPAGPPSRRRQRLPRWSLVGFAVVAGLAIGRFVTLDGGDAAGRPVPGVAAPAAPAPGTPAEQVAALEARVASQPDDGAAWARLGTEYARRAAETGDPSFYDLAERAFARAEEIAPGDPGLLLGRGALALSLHRFDEAEARGEEAVAALPANASALGILVDAQVELGRYDDAAVTLQDMLDVRPGLAALARTSYLRELRGDLPGATQAMSQAVGVATTSRYDTATVTALLGHLLLADGDLDGSLRSYDEALRSSPGHIEASLGRARVLAAGWDVDGATSVVEDVVDRFPSPAALTLLAELQHVAGDTEGEANTVDLVRLTSQLQAEAGQIVDLELALFEADVADDPDRAVALARESYEARPDNVFAADALAWALLQAGDVDAAVPHAEEAVRLGTAIPLLQYHAAEVFAATGDDARAAEHLRLALRGGTAFSVRHAAAAEALAGRLDVAVPSP